MPISSNASYLPTTDEFIAHWLEANIALGAAGPILLGGGVSVTGLSSLRTTLQTQRALVESERNNVEGVRADIEALKMALLDRLNQFNGKIKSLAPGSRWEGMLPKAFSLTDAMGRVVPALDDLYDVWQRYQEEQLEIFLMGGYSINDLTANLVTLKAFYQGYTSAVNGLKLARANRDGTQVMIYEILKMYRQRIPAEFAEGSALFQTLPRLSPLPGSTPDAVTLSGAYDAVESRAELAWTPPADAQVTDLELRATAGPDYEPEDETVLGHFAPMGPFAWAGSFGLGVPGAAASFKVYCVTAEGNERGSNAVTVTRPG